MVRVFAYCIEKGLSDIEENGIKLSGSYGQNAAAAPPENRIDVILALNNVDFEDFCKGLPDVEADEYFRLRTNIVRKVGGMKPLPPGWKVGDKEPEGSDDEAVFLAAEAAVSAPGDPYDESD